MNYKFGVYGDSIAFGYGNNNQSWFDELYLGSNALKLAQNGEKIEDVLSKIKQDNNHYDTLFLAVGINNLLSTSPQNNQIPITELISKPKENCLNRPHSLKLPKLIILGTLAPK